MRIRAINSPIDEPIIPKINAGVLVEIFMKLYPQLLQNFLSDSVSSPQFGQYIELSSISSLHLGIS